MELIILSYRYLTLAYLEGFEVIDEYVWHPEVVDEVEVDGGESFLAVRRQPAHGGVRSACWGGRGGVDP